MTYREFIRSGLPPAPETPALRRLRLVTIATCFLAAFSLLAVRSVENFAPALAVAALVLGVTGICVMIAFISSKVRHDLAYWTADQAAIARRVGALPPADPSLPQARLP